MYAAYHRGEKRILNFASELEEVFEQCKIKDQPITFSNFYSLLANLSVEDLITLYENHSEFKWFGPPDEFQLFDAITNLFESSYPRIPTMRHLIYHPESDCLFTVYSEETLAGAISGGECHDVTGISQFEVHYLEQERAICKAKIPLRKKLHEDLITRMQVPSCTNCINWSEKNELCTLYKARPPAPVIVASCGESWEPDIPF